MEKTFGTNSTAAFRCPLEHLQENIAGQGGLECLIITIGEHETTGPTNAQGNKFRKFSQHITTDGITTLFEIYCDGLPLPQGGTISVSLYRVRF